MKPAQALDTHALLAGVCSLSLAQRLVADLLGRQMDTVIGSEYVGDVLRNHLRAGYTHHLDARMNNAVETRAEALREISQYGQYEPPAECGVLVLDQPWEILEVSGIAQRVHIVTWGPIRVGDSTHAPRGGLLITWWQDTKRGTDPITEKILADPYINAQFRQLAGLHIVSAIAVYRDQRIGRYRNPVPEDKQAEMRAADRMPTDLLLNNPLHPLLATWQMMSESVANVADEPVERASRRRAHRAGIPQRVTVIQLRRDENAAHTGTGVPLAWRIPVKPHTRHYWVRDPETGELVREERQIATHWRGPEDAPIHVTDKVYTLRR